MRGNTLLFSHYNLLFCSAEKSDFICLSKLLMDVCVTASGLHAAALVDVYGISTCTLSFVSTLLVSSLKWVVRMRLDSK